MLAIDGIAQKRGGDGLRGAILREPRASPLAGPSSRPHCSRRNCPPRTRRWAPLRRRRRAPCARALIAGGPFLPWPRQYPPPAGDRLGPRRCAGCKARCLGRAIRRWRVDPAALLGEPDLIHDADLPVLKMGGHAEDRGKRGDAKPADAGHKDVVAVWARGWQRGSGRSRVLMRDWARGALACRRRRRRSSGKSLQRRRNPGCKSID